MSSRTGREVPPTGTAAPNWLRFSGRTAGRALRSGQYRLLARAAGGNAARAAFTVLVVKKR